MAVNVLFVASGLAMSASPVLAAAPVVGGTSTFEYLESDPALDVGTNITISSGVAYAGAYIEFGVGSSTASEVLAVSTDGAPVVTSGVVSIVGTDVYLGNGTIAEPIGSVDPTLDGTAGKALRVNFTNSFDNPSFETADLSSWTSLNQRIKLGSDQIAACDTVDTVAYPSTPNQDNNVPTAMGNYTTTIDSAEHSSGLYSLRLLSTGITTLAGYDVVHGPAVFSAPFDAAAGDSIFFDWKAMSGSDAESVFGYIVNTATCVQTEVLDHTGTSTSGSTLWSTVSTTIPTTGSYRFVFVSGTYDLSGGQAAGASMYIDNVRVYGTKATDDVAQQIARRLTYRNTAFDLPAARTITVTARNTALETGTAAITVNITPLDEAPVYLDSTLALLRLGTVYSDAAVSAQCR